MFKNETEITQQNWLKPNFNEIPEALKNQPWAVWKAEPRLKDNLPTGKYNKAPRNPLTGIKVGANQPDKFGTFEQAKAAYKTGNYTGVGVLLTGNGITGIDIDDAPITLKDQPDVKKWLEGAIICGAYCEHSPSGNGYRLFIYAALPANCRKKFGSLEIYDDVRFLTITGHSINEVQK